MTGLTVSPASPIGAALLRIVVPLLLWAEWGWELLPFRSLEPARLVLSASFFAVTAAMFVGLQGRFATAACAALLQVMVFGLGRSGFADWDHHHHALTAFVTTLLAFTPNSDLLSVDRWLHLRAGGDPRPRLHQTLALRLIGAQLCTVYFWGAVEKTNLPFLDGTRLTQLFLETWWGSAWAFPAWAGPGFAAAAVGVTALEYALAVGLWFPGPRRVLLPLGVVMHVVFYLTLPVATFSLLCIASYVAFLDQDQLERWVFRLLGGEAPGYAGGDSARETSCTESTPPS